MIWKWNPLSYPTGPSLHHLFSATGFISQGHTLPSPLAGGSRDLTPSILALSGLPHIWVRATKPHQCSVGGCGGHSPVWTQVTTVLEWCWLLIIVATHCRSKEDFSEWVAEQLVTLPVYLPSSDHFMLHPLVVINPDLHSDCKSQPCKPSSSPCVTKVMMKDLGSITSE